MISIKNNDLVSAFERYFNLLWSQAESYERTALLNPRGTEAIANELMYQVSQHDPPRMTTWLSFGRVYVEARYNEDTHRISKVFIGELPLIQSGVQCERFVKAVFAKAWVVTIIITR